MKRRRFYDLKHPFDPYRKCCFIYAHQRVKLWIVLLWLNGENFSECLAFEIFSCDTWKPVEYIRIEHGRMTVPVLENGYMFEDIRPFQRLRLRSRKATLNDCTCFLRPGIDVCVLYPLHEDDLVSVDTCNFEILLPKYYFSLRIWSISFLNRFGSTRGLFL